MMMFENHLQLEKQEMLTVQKDLYILCAILFYISTQFGCSVVQKCREPLQMLTLTYNRAGKTFFFPVFFFKQRFFG